MAERRLTYDEAMKLIDRQILQENGSYITVDGLSKNTLDEYVINDILPNPEKQEVLFDVSPLDKPLYKYRERIFKTHNEIATIAGQTIRDVLKAYCLNGAKTFKIYYPTNVEKDIIGHETGTIGSIPLVEGMKIVLYNDESKKYKNRTLKVIGVGRAIELTSCRGRPKSEE